jgi:hypothetical protein
MVPARVLARGLHFHGQGEWMLVFVQQHAHALMLIAQAWGLPERYSFVDVLGLDPELLSVVPRPVHDIVKRRTEEGPCAPVKPGDEPLWIPQVGVGECGAHDWLLTSQGIVAGRLR